MSQRFLLRTLFLSLLCVPLLAQQPPTDESSPTFRIDQSALSSHVTVIAYGDQRFHDHL